MKSIIFKMNGLIKPGIAPSKDGKVGASNAPRVRGLTFLRVLMEKLGKTPMKHKRIILKIGKNPPIPISTSFKKSEKIRKLAGTMGSVEQTHDDRGTPKPRVDTHEIDGILSATVFQPSISKRKILKVSGNLPTLQKNRENTTSVTPAIEPKTKIRLVKARVTYPTRVKSPHPGSKEKPRFFEDRSNADESKEGKSTQKSPTPVLSSKYRNTQEIPSTLKTRILEGHGDEPNVRTKDEKNTGKVETIKTKDRPPVEQEKHYRVKYAKKPGIVLEKTKKPKKVRYTEKLRAHVITEKKNVPKVIHGDSTLEASPGEVSRGKERIKSATFGQISVENEIPTVEHTMKLKTTGDNTGTHPHRISTIPKRSATVRTQPEDDGENTGESRRTGLKESLKENLKNKPAPYSRARQHFHKPQGNAPSRTLETQKVWDTIVMNRAETGEVSVAETSKGSFIPEQRPQHVTGKKIGVIHQPGYGDTENDDTGETFDPRVPLSKPEEKEKVHRIVKKRDGGHTPKDPGISGDLKPLHEPQVEKTQRFYPEDPRDNPGKMEAAENRTITVTTPHRLSQESKIAPKRADTPKMKMIPPLRERRIIVEPSLPFFRESNPIVEKPHTYTIPNQLDRESPKTGKPVESGKTPPASYETHRRIMPTTVDEHAGKTMPFLKTLKRISRYSKKITFSKIERVKLPIVRTPVIEKNLEIARHKGKWIYRDIPRRDVETVVKKNILHRVDNESKAPEEIKKTIENVKTEETKVKEVNVVSTNNTRSSTSVMTSTPMESNRPEVLVKQIAEKFMDLGTSVRKNEIITVKIQLHPPKLGEVDLEITRDEHGYRVVFSVTRKDSQDLLEKVIPMLREKLKDEGISDIRFEVNQREQGDQRDHDEEEQGNAPNHEHQRQWKRRHFATFFEEVKDDDKRGQQLDFASIYTTSIGEG